MLEADYGGTRPTRADRTTYRTIGRLSNEQAKVVAKQHKGSSVKSVHRTGSKFRHFFGSKLPIIR